MTTPNNDRPTPETDANCFVGAGGATMVGVYFARTLERRLAEANEKLERIAFEKSLTAPPPTMAMLRDPAEEAALRTRLAATETALAKTREALKTADDALHCISKFAPDAVASAYTPEEQDETDAALSLTPEHVSDHLAAVEAERDRANLHLGNLLARIHRDGGHYQSAHGTEKAVEDADRIVAEMNAERDQLRAALRAEGGGK